MNDSSDPSQPLGLVSASNLMYQCGGQVLVNQLSMDIFPGEVWGLLGSNGAGKSTTMKLLTGYLTPDSGKIVIAGYDMATQTQEAQKHLGYLPEHNPLDTSMYVLEYLQYMAHVRGVFGELCQKRVTHVVQQCGLLEVQHKKIGVLSKGYRQRVGLAQAMVHDPSVLILDEPTTGLDPNQLVDMRAMIKALSCDKAIILSTHIMQEVEAMCDRALVLHQGEPVACASLSTLGHEEPTCWQIAFAEAIPMAWLQQIEGVQWVAQSEPQGFRLEIIGDERSVERKLVHFAASHQLTMIKCCREKTSDLAGLFGFWSRRHGGRREHSPIGY